MGGDVDALFAEDNPRAARDVFQYYRKCLHLETPEGRGIQINRMSVEAATQNGEAIIVGSSEKLVHKIVDVSQIVGSAVSWDR